jgi:hypothetical protein
VLKKVAIAGNRDVIKRKAKKIIKYKDTAVEKQRMWYVKLNNSNLK